MMVYITDPADHCDDCAELRRCLEEVGHPNPSVIRCKRHRSSTVPYLDIGPASFCPDCNASTSGLCWRHSRNIVTVPLVLLPAGTYLR